jgi:ribosomal protein L30/L7E
MRTATRCSCRSSSSGTSRRAFLRPRSGPRRPTSTLRSLRLRERRFLFPSESELGIRNRFRFRFGFRLRVADTGCQAFFPSRFARTTSSSGRVGPRRPTSTLRSLRLRERRFLFPSESELGIRNRFRFRFGFRLRVADTGCQAFFPSRFARTTSSSGRVGPRRPTSTLRSLRLRERRFLFPSESELGIRNRFRFGFRLRVADSGCQAFFPSRFERTTSSSGRVGPRRPTFRVLRAFRRQFRRVGDRVGTRLRSRPSCSPVRRPGPMGGDG